jgi:hypothetical protein
MNPEPQELFVYGTLRKGGANPMHDFLAREADFVGAATCCGLLYRVDFYPGLVPSGAPDDRVHGEVYRCTARPSPWRNWTAMKPAAPGSPRPPNTYARWPRYACTTGATFRHGYTSTTGPSTAWN